MSDPDGIDFFRSGAVLRDPYPYYEDLRNRCPVHREPHEGVVMVTGYDEALIGDDADGKPPPSAPSLVFLHPQLPFRLEGRPS